MAYHNAICNKNDKSDYTIFTRCNCDKRFMRMTIEVIENE